MIVKKTGTIEALNVSPKGSYEGLLLRTGKKIIQINLPKEKRGALGKSLNAGDLITAEVEPEKPHGKPNHVVLRFVRLHSPQSQRAHGDKHASRPFSGRIERVNYALHGEINGGILDSGDFLHLKPAGARAVSLKAGMQVKGLGTTKPMVGGHSVIEAEELNGIVIRALNKKKKDAAKQTRH